MKFRKMKSTMLAALMFTSFTACANNENPADTNSPENQAQQQAESTEEDTQNTDQNPEEITDNEESSNENTEINIPEAVNLTDDGSYTTSLIPERSRRILGKCLRHGNSRGLFNCKVIFGLC